MPAGSLRLLVDAGNTTIKIGLADDGGLFTSYVLPTDKTATPDSLGLSLSTLAAHAEIAATAISSAIISSVVPPMDPILTQACQ
jgi:type III pantothenate kinase